MTSKREKLQYAYVFFADLLTMAVSVLLAWLITDGLFGVLIPYTSTDWLQTLCLLFVAFVVTFFFFDQDKNIVTRSENEEISLSLRFNIAFGLVYAGCMLLAKATMLDSRYFAVTVPAVNAVLLPFSHAILKRLLIRFQRSWGMETLVGVVTTSDRAERLISEIRKDWSRRVVGVSLLEATPAAISTRVCGVEVKATFDDFMDWIRREALDEVYVDVPMDSGESFIPYLDEMESMGLTVHFRLPLLDRIEEACCDETSAARLSRSLGRCAGGNIVTMGTVELQLRDQIAKRCMDVVGAVIGCIISIPIIAVVAIPLKLESPGPLFFKQKRVGRNGRYFYIHKLRSMYVDAEARKKELMAQNEMNGLMFKMEDDPRVTKVGKFIRRTSIDELPQFFDVLRGDMSLVGTRPPTVDEYKQYESHHKRRLSMKPGITGLWQVSGRSDIQDFEEQVLFITDNILDQFAANHSLVTLISKHLSWGFFKNSLTFSPFSDAPAIYTIYESLLSHAAYTYRSPELMFYMILELVSGTSYNAILYQQPIPLEDLKPELYDAIRGIFKQFRIRKKRNVTESTEKTISSAQQPDHPAPLRAAQ